MNLDRKGEKLELYIELSKLKAMLPQGADYLSDKEYYVEKKVEAGKTTLSAEPVEECYINLEEIKLPFRIILQKMVLVNIVTEWTLKIFVKLVYTGGEHFVSQLMNDGFEFELKWGKDTLKVLSEKTYVFDTEDMNIGIDISGKVEVTYTEYDIKNNKFKMLFSSFFSNDATKYIMRLKEKLDWQLAYNKKWTVKPMCWPFEKPLEIGGIGDWVTFPKLPFFEAFAIQLPEIELGLPGFDLFGAFKIALEPISIPLDIGELKLEGLSIPFLDILKYLGIGDIIGDIKFGDFLPVNLDCRLIEGKYKVSFEENDVVIVSFDFDNNGVGLMVEATAGSNSVEVEIKEATFIYIEGLLFAELTGHTELVLGDGSSLETSLRIDFEKTAVEVTSGIPIYSHYLEIKFDSDYGLALDFAAEAYWVDEIWNSAFIREIGRFVREEDYRLSEEALSELACHGAVDYLSFDIPFLHREVVLIENKNRMAASRGISSAKSVVAAFLNFCKSRNLMELIKLIDIEDRTLELDWYMGVIKGLIACGLGSPSELGLKEISDENLALVLSGEMETALCKASACSVSTIDTKLNLNLDFMMSASLKYFMDMYYLLNVTGKNAGGNISFHRGSFIFAKGTLNSENLVDGFTSFSGLGTAWVEFKDLTFLPSCPLFGDIKMSGYMFRDGRLLLQSSVQNIDIGLKLGKAVAEIESSQNVKKIQLRSEWMEQQLNFDFYLNGRGELCAESSISMNLEVCYTMPVFTFFNGTKVGGNPVRFDVKVTFYINIKNGELKLRCMAKFTFMGSSYSLDLKLSTSEIPNTLNGLRYLIANKVLEWIEENIIPDMGNPEDAGQFLQLLFSGLLDIGDGMLKNIHNILVRDFKMPLSDLSDSLKNNLGLSNKDITNKVEAVAQAIGSTGQAVQKALGSIGISYDPSSFGGGDDDGGWLNPGNWF